MGPGAEGPRKIFETFCMGVGKILSLGGSKYRPGGGGLVGGWAGRQTRTQKFLGRAPTGVGKKEPAGRDKERSFYVP
jgi:hypothetical protein